MLLLLPIYVENYQLNQFVHSVAVEPGAVSQPDEALRPRILRRAQELNLPVHPGDVEISRSEGRLKLVARYKVQKDLGLAHVDLHFHPEASGQTPGGAQPAAR